MERLTELDMNSIGFAILCNFPHFCGEERAKEAAEMLRTMKKEIMEYRALGPIARLRELAQADREERVVVLPCKVGDTLFCLDRYKGKILERIADRFTVGENGYINIWYGTSVSVNADRLGKTVFLAREEAKKALEGGGEDD